MLLPRLTGKLSAKERGTLGAGSGAGDSTVSGTLSELTVWLVSPWRDCASSTIPAAGSSEGDVSPQAVTPPAIARLKARWRLKFFIKMFKVAFFLLVVESDDLELKTYAKAQDGTQAKKGCIFGSLFIIGVNFLVHGVSVVMAFRFARSGYQ